MILMLIPKARSMSAIITLVLAATPALGMMQNGSTNLTSCQDAHEVCGPSETWSCRDSQCVSSQWWCQGGCGPACYKDVALDCDCANLANCPYAREYCSEGYLYSTGKEGCVKNSCQAGCGYACEDCAHDCNCGQIDSCPYAEEVCPRPFAYNCEDQTCRLWMPLAGYANLGDWQQVFCNMDGSISYTITQSTSSAHQLSESTALKIGGSLQGGINFFGLAKETLSISTSVSQTIANSWTDTWSTTESVSVECDYYEDEKPFTGGCMWQWHMQMKGPLNDVQWSAGITACTRGPTPPTCPPFTTLVVHAVDESTCQADPIVQTHLVV